ncbi:unnamed protein product [Phytophthora lilii]|uniref:Unnamed protein product n=1 Tax=Phytophthora lilii TaxID=2077276 RepID=A0A9W7D9B6_9STRA|nr:unnamed protein product [Phytophthora lilii]
MLTIIQDHTNTKNTGSKNTAPQKPQAKGKRRASTKSRFADFQRATALNQYAALAASDSKDEDEEHMAISGTDH